MNKNLLMLLGLAIVVLLLTASPAFAKDDLAGTGSFYGVALGVGFGTGITLIGAGLGFGRIGAAALESMARQPDPAVMNRLFTTMLLIGALLEGATFFSLIVCLLVMVL
jgi:F-type H+-transporting ATPase subunit c